MSCKIGIIWDEEVEWKGPTPFEEDHMNHTYAEMAEIAGKRDAEIIVANYNWYDDGIWKKAYMYDVDEGEWRKVRRKEVDVIFDKYKFDDETRELKQELQLKIPVLNSFELDEICKDKLLSYQKFPELLPKTVKATEKNVEDYFFDHEKAIVKPRYDFGGHGIKIIESPEEFEPGEDLILQEFIDSSTGIAELDVEGAHDLRVLVMNGEIAGSYLRIPEAESLISNVSRGGTIRFVDIDQIPEKVLDIVEKVKNEFSRFEPAFYSVDTIIDSEGEAYVLEFNSKPGLSFYDDEEIEKHKRPIIKKLVETLVEMS